MNFHDLNDRKRRILAAIIESYIDSAEPIGSKAVASAAGLGVSSATIRNEMAELVELGWLEQPHTSAGRVPSARGYRAYVDWLMKRYQLKESDRAATDAFVNGRINELERLLTEAGRVISELSGYPSLTMTPRLHNSLLRRVELLAVDRHQFVLVLISSDGIIKNRICRTAQPLPLELLPEISSLLERQLYGQPLSALAHDVVSELATALGEYAFVLPPVLQAIAELSDELSQPSVILGGEQRLLALPEYRDYERTREFLSFLFDQEARRKVLTPAEGSEGIVVTIGDEHPLEQLRDSSVIMGNYKLGDRSVGIVAIIGPTRMEYNRVLGQFEYFTQSLNKLLAQLFDLNKE